MKNIQNNNGKNKKKSSDPWARSGERPGRGHGSELFSFFFFFFVFPWFFAVWPKPQEQKKIRPMGKVWAIHTQTKKPKNQKNKKPKNQKPKKPKNKKKQKKQKDKTQHSASDPLPLGCVILFFLFFWFFVFLVSCFFVFLVCVWIAQALPMGLNFFFVFFCSRGFGQTAKNHGKTKKPKNQETKKPKKPKKQDCTPQGEGVRCRVLGLVFLCFLFFWFIVFWFFVFLVFWFFGVLVFWFFGFLVFCFFVFLVWIAIADVPSRDCQALSVVALEARSIHHSTAMFAMT